MTEPAGYSRSEELADSMMFEEAGSEATGSSDTYATEHVPAARKSTKKKDDLTTREYYFEGIEKLSPAQITRLDKLYQRRDELKLTLDKLSGITVEAVKDTKPKLTDQQVKANQLARMAAVDISKFVKAGWQTAGGFNFVGMWNPDDLLPATGPTAICVQVKGLNPSKVDPTKSNMKKVIAGEQMPELWEPGLDSLFMSIPHATEEEFEQMSKACSLQGSRKDKPSKPTKLKKEKTKK